MAPGTARGPHATAPSLSLTPTGRFLLAASAVAVALGFWSGSRPLAIAGQALGVAVLALALASRGALKGARLTRRHPAWAFEDELMDVRLGLSNEGRLPLRWLESEDRFGADRESAKTVCLPGPLRSGRKEETVYAAACSRRRGAYAIGPALLSLEDPLGASRSSLTCRGATPLTVFPRAVPLARLPISGRARWDNVDTETLPRTGTSLNFSGTREYREGDPLRFVHWGATAHAGRLVVKEFELNIATEVSVFLDAHYLVLKGMGREATFEYGVRAAASIARHALDRGSRVRLVCASKAPAALALAGGEIQLLSILRALTAVQPDGPEPLSKVLALRLDEVETGSTAALILSAQALDLRAFARPFAILRARQVRLLVVLLDDGSFLNLWESTHRRRDRPAIAVPEIVSLLAGMGITVYTLAQGQDLADRLGRPYAYAPRPG